VSIGGGKETGEPREETSGTDVGAGGRGRNDRTGRPPPAAANPNGVVGAERAAGDGSTDEQRMEMRMRTFHYSAACSPR